MDNIVISQWRNSQWNGDLKSTMEEYSTSFNDSMSGDLLICPRYLILKMIGLIFGIFFVMIWPIIAWILLKLVGYAVIGLTLGDGYEFVNSTFLQWADEIVKNFDWFFKQVNGVFLFHLFYVSSLTLGKEVFRNGQSTQF